MQQIGDRLLAALQLGQITQRLQNPRAQFASAHRGDRAIQHSKQARVPRAARFNQLKIGLRSGIEHDVIRGRVAAQRRKVIDFAPKLMFQIMNNCSSGGDRLEHLRAAKSVERFDLEMLAQSENRLFRQKRVTIVAKRASDLVEVMLLLIADEEF